MMKLEAALTNADTHPDIDAARWRELAERYEGALRAILARARGQKFNPHLGGIKLLHDNKLDDMVQIAETVLGEHLKPHSDREAAAAKTAYLAITIDADAFKKPGEHDYEDRDDGLSHCLVCGGAEASMPSQCPGRPMTAPEVHGVMIGSLDFRNGQFVEVGLYSVWRGDPQGGDYENVPFTYLTEDEKVRVDDGKLKRLPNTMRQTWPRRA